MLQINSVDPKTIQIEDQNAIFSSFKMGWSKKRFTKRFIIQNLNISRFNMSRCVQHNMYTSQILTFFLLKTGKHIPNR